MPHLLTTDSSFFYIHYVVIMHFADEENSQSLPGGTHILNGIYFYLFNYPLTISRQYKSAKEKKQGVLTGAVLDG